MCEDIFALYFNIRQKLLTYYSVFVVYFEK